MAFVAAICGKDSEEESPPKHAYAFGNFGRLRRQRVEERVAALKTLHTEVTAKKFPYAERNVTIAPPPVRKKNFSKPDKGRQVSVRTKSHRMS